MATMSLYKVYLEKEDNCSYYYVEAKSVEEAVAEAERMNPNWTVAKKKRSNDPNVELVIEGILW